MIGCRERERERKRKRIQERERNKNYNDFVSANYNYCIPQEGPALKKWKCLAAKQRASAPPRTVSSGAQFELTKYLIEVRNSAVVVEDAFEFWRLSVLSIQR
jgi:hypothetical protein